jgi:hypothetical protein
MRQAESFTGVDLVVPGHAGRRLARQSSSDPPLLAQNARGREHFKPGLGRAEAVSIG